MSSRGAASDILLLQEVDWNAERSRWTDIPSFLARRLNKTAVFGAEFEELGQERAGAAALTGQATLTSLPVKSARVLRFARQSTFRRPPPWLPSAAPLLQRRMGSWIALVTELDWQGLPLVVYNAHLESRSAGFIQAAQLEEIIADANRYPSATPVLLGGDLNTKYLPAHFLRRLEGASFSERSGRQDRKNA